MADDTLPDLSPDALCRLVAGMTTDEVEAIVGCFHRPALYEGREYLWWIGDGSMLQAYFNGPSQTLSAAMLELFESRRPLYLGPDRRRRRRQCTVMQTWYCIPCRRRNRQPQSGRPVICSECGGACEKIIGSIRVPSPKYTKAWDKFWAQYKAEMELLDAYNRGELREAVTLKLFDLRLPKSRRKKRST